MVSRIVRLPLRKYQDAFTERKSMMNELPAGSASFVS